MTYTQKRKIVVDDIEYEWCIRGQTLCSDTNYLTIYKPNMSGMPIHLDPYAWDLEIRPRTVAEAIKFSLKNGWNPSNKGKSFRVGFFREEYIVLPDGCKNSDDYKNMVEK